MRTKEQVKAELIEADNRLEALKLELADMESIKFSRATDFPYKVGREYHHITSYLDTTVAADNHVTINDLHYDNYNYFITSAQAQHAAGLVKRLLFMIRWKHDFDNGYEFIKNEGNYVIRYSYNENKYNVVELRWTDYLNGIYFSSREKAELCLRDMKKAGVL